MLSRFRRTLFSLLLSAPVLSDADEISAPLAELAARDLIDWQAWNEAAITAARKRNVPIYICIGERLNEFTVAMHRQTFNTPELVSFVEENFVCVLVSREQAPGLEAFGQQWLTHERRPRGMPLNLWFTPDLRPIEASGYLPPYDNRSHESLRTIGARVAGNWRKDSEAVDRAAADLQRQLKNFEPLPTPSFTDLEAALDAATEDWLAINDVRRGVFGPPRHHGESELLRYLFKAGDDARVAALASLRARLSGALRDPLDGGFYYGTVDNVGSIPIFQKRMSDQARMALACLDAARIDDDPLFPVAARGALFYVLTRLANEDGTFRVGEDAGPSSLIKTQTWSFEELDAIVGRENAAALGARPGGNIDPREDLEATHTGRNILYASPTADLAVATKRLLAVRDQRSDTRIESTATLGEHALLLLALARAGRDLDDSVLSRAGNDLAATLRERFVLGGNAALHHPDHDAPATPQDLLLLALATGDQPLARRVDARFLDDEVGLYFATEHAIMGVRPYSILLGSAELPSAVTLRVMMDDAPASVMARIQGQLHNVGSLPSGPTLLAMQRMNLAASAKSATARHRVTRVDATGRDAE